MKKSHQSRNAVARRVARQENMRKGRFDHVSKLVRGTTVEEEMADALRAEHDAARQKKMEMEEVLRVAYENTKEYLEEELFYSTFDFYQMPDSYYAA